MTDELPLYIYGRECGPNEKVLPIADVRAAIDAAVARERETIRQLRSVLRVIAERDKQENFLDPQWAARIAKSGLDATAIRSRGNNKPTT